MNLFRLMQQCLYPALCRACSKIIVAQDVFCASCAMTIKPLVSKMIPITKNLTLSVYAVSDYVDPVKLLVLKKFTGDVSASRHLAFLMLKMLPINTFAIDYVVPVPLHWTRYAWRGFNQSYEMARVIGKQIEAPVIRLVRRNRKTAFQSQLSVLERAENVHHAFDVNYWYKMVGTDCIRGKHILIVDDLCTTGATLTQIAKAIAPLKPASLTAVVGCRIV